MKFRIWKALARGVVLESIRRKDIWVVAILGFIIMLSAGALGFFGMRGLEMFAKDLGITVLGLFGTIVAILTSTRMMPDEIKNRTLYPLLSRPITRFDLLFGKFIGSVLVSWAAFLILAALTSVALLMFGVQFEAIMAQYLVAKMMGFVVVCAIGVMFSVMMTPSAAATMAFVLAFGSGMMVRALTMAGTTAPDSMIPVLQTLNAILPQIGLFDLGQRAVNEGWSPVPLWVMASLFAYMAAYSAGMLALSWTKFRKQAV